ncbi:MAG: hypothetical protein ACAI44_05840, partial [Candidatus Sericytochromatia bacterium]
MWIQPELSADEERLHKLILERGLVPEQQLKELLGQRQELVKQAIEQLKGKLIQIEDNKLRILRVPEKELIGEIPL